MPDERKPPSSDRSRHQKRELSSVHDVEASSRRPWDDLVACPEGRAELSVPGSPAVSYPLPVTHLDHAIEAAITRWFGEPMLVHWRALRSLPVTNGRAQWKLDAHMTMLGMGRDAQMRAQVSREVEHLAKLEMTVYTPGDRLRLRAPLLMPIATTERQHERGWLLADMILRVHPLLLEAALEAGGEFPAESPTQKRPSHPTPKPGYVPDKKLGTQS